MRRDIALARIEQYILAGDVPAVAHQCSVRESLRLRGGVAVIDGENVPRLEASGDPFHPAQRLQVDLRARTVWRIRKVAIQVLPDLARDRVALHPDEAIAA